MENNIEKKYIPLANYFQASKEGILKLSFEEIETIVGQKLPNTAYLNKSWWKKTKPPLQHFLAWTNNDYFVSKVQPGYYVQFEKPQYQSSNFTDADGKTPYTYIIRPAELDDARILIKLLQKLRETKSELHYDLIQIPDTPTAFRKRIAAWNAKGLGQIFVAIIDGHVQGFVQVVRNSSCNLQHRAEISLAVSAEYTNQDIDFSLLEAAQKWATTHKISRLELSLLETNNCAIERYKKFGFSIEGIRRNALFIENIFYDELYMGKIF